MDDFSLIRQIKEWWWLISLGSTGAFAWMMLYLQNKFITKEEHTKQLASLSTQMNDVQTDIDQVGNRVVRLENITENLPDREAFQEMTDRISNVEKAVAVTTETVRGTNVIVAKIDRTLDLFLQSQLQKSEGKSS